MKQPIVAISGVHSDPDPSPGIGIARSIRDAFPEALLYGIDYSIRSSGLHHPIFDAVRLQPVWSELDLETYCNQIKNHLSQPLACWISGLDVEADWLARTVYESPRLLIPSTLAQQSIRKPMLACASSLGMRVPEYLPAEYPASELHALGRRNAWLLWVKGKYHEAYRAQGFADLRRQIRALEQHWPIDNIFVQAHVAGLERSITFAAYEGQLLDAVEIDKRSVTSQGKTWAAAVMSVSEETKERLSSFLATVGWTGGGEVEFVRDMSGIDWLIDVNPRFPAYIYGVTLCGRNLPSILLAAALDLDLPLATHHSKQFIRVVQEIPISDALPLPRLVADSIGMGIAGKHPSFQPELVRRLGIASPKRVPNHIQTSVEVPPFLPKLHLPERTPARIRDFSLAEQVINQLAAALQNIPGVPQIMPALSIKTDPQPNLVRTFLDRGWWSEVISQQELAFVTEIGFPAHRIVFNGPIVGVLTQGVRVGIAFADSVEAFEHLLNLDICDVVGVRVKPSVVSRFGVDLRDFSVFTRISNCLRTAGNHRKLGLHMHFASDLSGPVLWEDMVNQTLIWADALTKASGATFTVLDCGGGWHTEDFTDWLLPLLPSLRKRIAQAMPNIETIFLEPGKAIATNTAWLATRIIEVRANTNGRDNDIVVDASIADLPMASHYTHRILHLRDVNCLGSLVGGTGRILGSICMESDILAEGISFAHVPLVDDILLFSSAGGYNASMAWPFASGVSRDS